MENEIILGGNETIIPNNFWESSISRKGNGAARITILESDLWTNFYLTCQVHNSFRLNSKLIHITIFLCISS